MPFDFSQVKDQHFGEILKKTPHLLRYLDTYTNQGNPLPIFTDQLKPEHKKLKEPNIIYPVSEQSFIHINPHTTSDDGYMEYVIIEPDLPERKIMDMADSMFAAKSGCISKKDSASTNSEISSTMSYGLLGLSGIIESSLSPALETAGAIAIDSVRSSQFCGR